jgi:prephenate dehydratase
MDSEPIRVGYQGAPGAFSEDAARALVASPARLEPLETLDAVFDALDTARVDTAVVPIENTLAGAVPGCADLLVRHGVHIVAERVQRIEHALIAPPGRPLAAIRRVLSHPVAIAQCEGFFRAHRGMAAVPVFDTAGAVARVMQDESDDSAAIASRRAAEVYGGVVLADGIQDSADNFTRFLRVDPGPTPPGWRAGHKTSLFCVLPNEPGSLVRALQSLSSRGLNLSRIESRPIRERPFEYGFHIDVGPAPDLDALAAAIDDLASRCRQLQVLGHYSVRTPEPRNPGTPEPRTFS